MNKLNFTKFLLIVALAVCPLAFYGQENDTIAENKNDVKTFKDYVYVSGDFGLGFLKGDNLKLKTDFNGHIGFGYQFDYILGVKANLGYGSLNGNFEDFGLTIDKMNYFEANLNLTVSLTDIIFGYNPDRIVNFVPHIGIGQLRYKIKNVTTSGNTYTNIEERKVVATIPMGAELNFRLNNNWKLYLDFVANYADTELLDGVISGEHNDWFASVNVGATYRLGDKANIFRRQPEFCNYWFWMIDGGASLLFGDNKYDFSTVRGNLNLGVGYNFHNFYRVYGRIGYGIYTGENPGFYTLDYADYYGANINISADLVGLIFGYKETRRVGLYPHIGIGQIQYRARTTFADGTQKQYGYDHNATTNTKGDGIADRRVVMTVPMGVEFTYNMSEKADIFVDVTTNRADSDVLDCVKSGESKDYFNTFNIGIRHKFATSCVRAAKAALRNECCMTYDELKEAVKEALKEEDITSRETVKHNNFTNIVFPINEIDKVDTQTNIDALNRAVADIKKGWEIERIVIEGFTSPDGCENSNINLAKERANSAKTLVSETLNVDESMIEMVSKGPDWDGLFSAIEGSDIENKDEILEQIKNSDNREQTLRDLISTNKQLNDLLPQLRRAAVTITTVKK